MNLMIVVSLIWLVRAKRHHYTPDWNDLDQRPLPRWYEKAKIGVMVHWGVYSVPAYGPHSATNSEWILKYWKTGNREIQYYMDTHYSTGVKYKDLARNFTAKHFNPDKWADLFKRAGAKYVILSAKHQDGYLLFDSETTNTWKSVATGPHRDLVQDLGEAVRKKGLEFGVYYSLHEWYNNDYLYDKKTQFLTNKYAINKVHTDLTTLVINYKPSVIWSDGDWDNSPDYWNSTKFLAWLYNTSPLNRKVVVNDRWGQGTWGRHGDFYNYRDRYNPRVKQSHKWENSFSLDKHSWGYRRNIGNDLMTFEELLDNLVSTVSCGGNVLINFGATYDGRIPKEFQNLLVALGEWLDVNGEAIYDTSPWIYQNEFDSKVWFTCKTSKYDGLYPIATPWQPDISATYAIFFTWPKTGVLKLKSIKNLLTARDHIIVLLGYNSTLKWKIRGEVVQINLPELLSMPSKYAWTLKLSSKTSLKDTF